jgi:Protein of unknown function (DUF998)
MLTSKPMNPNLLSFTAILATIFYALTIVLFFVLHFVKSHYSILKHAVSDYAVGSTAKLFQSYVWLGTVGALVLTVLFYYARQPKFPALIALWTLLMVGSRIGVSVFKTDLEGQTRTREGRIHYVFAILTFAFAYTAIENATPIFIADDATFPSSLLGILRYIAMISLIGVVVTMFKPLRRFFGVIERVFLLSTLVWFLIASYLLIR